MLRIRRSQLETLAHQALGDYPKVCAGVLAGRIEEGQRIVRSIHALPTESPVGVRSLITPREYIETEARIEASGSKVVGLYHSHPDQPDGPTELDEEDAREGLSYLYISVTKEENVTFSSWYLPPGAHQLEKEEILTTEGG